jgi:CheY-like chemotaxis protein
MNPAAAPNNDQTAPLGKILVVEDDLCAAQLYRILLQKDGYAVTHCGDGEAALEALAKERFDAVVLDLMMPKVDGIQVLKSIRASSVNPLMPVIILTAARLKVVEEEAFRLGARHFLDKTQSGQLLVELRKAMAEKPETDGGSLRLAPLAPIQDPKRSRSGRESPPSEPARKPASSTGLGWFFRSRNAVE